MTKVQEWIQNQKNLKEEEKNQLLIALGLYDKIYSDTLTELNAEYPYIDEDNKANSHPHTPYKKVPCSVSEAEWEEIIKYKQENLLKNKPMTVKINACVNGQTLSSHLQRLSTILEIISIIFLIVGLIAGFVIGYGTAEYGGFNIGFSILVWITSALFFIFNLVQSAILSCLNDIRVKSYEINNVDI